MDGKKYPLIGTKPGGTSPAIAGTRIRVALIAQAYRRLGTGPKAVQGLLKSYPHLTREQVVAAIDYWHDHRDEIEAEIAEEHQIFEQMQAEQAARLASKTR